MRDIRISISARVPEAMDQSTFMVAACNVILALKEAPNFGVIEIFMENDGETEEANG